VPPAFCRSPHYDNKIVTIFKNNGQCKRIGEIEGIGPLTATAVIAAIGDPKVFKNGRQMAAWLGLVPRQHSSGGKQVLLGISKRGDRYLRTLLIHGARTVVRHCDKKQDSRSKLIKAKKIGCGANKASVALANKNARVIWALLANEENYRKAA